MKFARSVKHSLLLSCLLSMVAVGLTTEGLLQLQMFVTRLEHNYVHPYTMGYLLPIAFLTYLGGRRNGFLALFLSVLGSAYLIIQSHFPFSSHRSSDSVGLALLLIIGVVVVVGMDALQRNIEYLQSVQASEARLKTVMETSPVGLVTCDREGHLLYANPAAERLWGHSFKAVGKEGWESYRMLNPDGSPTPTNQTTLARVLAGEASILGRELILQQPDGQRVWIEASSTLLVDAQGSPTGGLVVMQNIQKRKEAELANAELLIQAEARAEREALLNRIGQAIRNSVDSDVILEQVTALLGKAMAADRCYFTFQDQAHGTVQIGPDWHGLEMPSLAGQHTLTDFDTHWDQLFPEGDTLVAVGDGSSGLSPETIEAFARKGVRATISVPLLKSGRVVGALAVTMAEQTRLWTQEEVSLVETVAAQTRAALEMAQVRRREQTIASVLQDALRPHLPKNISGLEMAEFYRPALEEANVGGDFFDVFPLTRDRYAIVVGDVSGKGLAAAKQIATVRNMLRYALYQEKTVAEAVTDLNKIITEKELLEGFATLFVSVYESDPHRLQYVSCGHEPALIRCVDGSVLEMLPTGPVLGLSETVGYEQDSQALEPGDVFVIYTDGISEAGRSRQNLWGADGIAALLRRLPLQSSADEVMNQVVAGAVYHAQDDLHDDICLLVGVVRPLIEGAPHHE